MEPASYIEHALQEDKTEYDPSVATDSETFPEGIQDAQEAFQDTVAELVIQPGTSDVEVFNAVDDGTDRPAMYSR